MRFTISQVLAESKFNKWCMLLTRSLWSRGQAGLFPLSVILIDGVKKSNQYILNLLNLYLCYDDWGIFQKLCSSSSITDQLTF